MNVSVAQSLSPTADDDAHFYRPIFHFPLGIVLVRKGQGKWKEMDVSSSFFLLFLLHVAIILLPRADEAIWIPRFCRLAPIQSLRRRRMPSAVCQRQSLSKK